MKFRLNTWGRIMLTIVVGNLRGTVAMMRKASKALDILEMSEQDEALVGLSRDPAGNVSWANTDHIWELEIKDREAAGLVRQAFQRHDGWPAARAKEVLELANQLGLKEEEDIDEDLDILEVDAIHLRDP